MKRELLLSCLVLSVIAAAGQAAAQSGTRGYFPPSNTQGSGMRVVERPFDERFWAYLKQAEYRNWAPLPGQTAEAYVGQSPHGARVKLYANRAAFGGNGEIPIGSVLVKENYDESGSRLMAVTVMYRAKGFAPTTGDWYWAKYEPTGAVSLMNNQRVSGRVNMCIECHKSAGGDDFVFANDP